MSLIKTKEISGRQELKKLHLTLNFTFSGQFGSLITLRHVLRWSWSFQKLMKVRRTSDFSVFQVWKFSFQDQEFINCKNCPCRTFFSIFDVRYFFNTTTVTYRNPVKHNWNSTRKTKKKIAFFYPITPWNQKNVRICYFWGYFGGLETSMEFNAFLRFCEFLKV